MNNDDIKIREEDITDRPWWYLVTSGVQWVAFLVVVICAFIIIATAHLPTACFIAGLVVGRWIGKNVDK